MTETRAADERHDPPFVADERQMLDAWLDYHRATLLLTCEGLTDQQLKIRSVEPSSLSLLGLVRHMAEVERHWFRKVLAAQATKPLYYGPGNDDGDFDDVDSADVTEDLARYRSEVADCRRIAAEHPDLEAFAKGDRRGRDISLRWIYVHMIEEYARHNGHADFLRERIDGRTGL